MSKKNKEKELSNRLEDTENKLKRALADYSNFQRRTEEEKERFGSLIRSNVVQRFLEPLDTIEQILKSEVPKNLKESLEMTIKQYKKAFEEEGVSEIESTGEFDPSTQEAVDVTIGEKDNQVIETIQKGYKLGDLILRPARVRVSRKGEAS